MRLGSGPKSNAIPASVHRRTPRLNRERVTAREWHKDKEKLDLHRPLPPGSVSKSELASIDPDLFLAWNLVQHRWEVWCRRDEERLPPYFVMRIITHPPNRYDERGQVIWSCPGRPERSRKSPSCPPSCHGQYEVPDRRMLKFLRLASVKHNQAADMVARMEKMEDDEREQAYRRGFNRYSDKVTYWWNQIAGIQQVGYSGRRH